MKKRGESLYKDDIPLSDFGIEGSWGGVFSCCSKRALREAIAEDLGASFEESGVTDLG